MTKSRLYFFIDQKFKENNFRHLAESKIDFLSQQNIFVKCPGLKRKFGKYFLSKSSHPKETTLLDHKVSKLSCRLPGLDLEMMKMIDSGGALSSLALGEKKGFLGH